MDPPLTIVTSILSAVIAVQTCLSQEDKKDVAIVNLSTTVDLVFDILEPLQDERLAKTLDSNVILCLLAIGDALGRIQDHISIWKDQGIPQNGLLRRGCTSHSGILEYLRDDRQRLKQLVVVVTLALQLSCLIDERSKMSLVQNSPGTSSLESIQNPDVKNFWRTEIGGEVWCASRSQFSHAAKNSLQVDLDPSVWDILYLRLDEYKVGGVTPASLEKFVGAGTVNDAIRHLQNEDTDRPPQQDDSTSDLSRFEKVLVWIDDNPSNNTTEIFHAKDLGIEVCEFSSTASAKAWIEANEEQLHRMDHTGSLRFISDNARWEGGSESYVDSTGGYLNLSAGEAILRFIRGRHFMAPVLIYCGMSIDSTGYVDDFERAGSTTGGYVCRSFISGLASGKDVEDWQKFKAY